VSALRVKAENPVIPWGWIAVLHFSAAFGVMVVYLATAGPDPSGLKFIGIGVIPVLVGGALPPYLAAVVTWWLATAWGRGRIREVLAVSAGALVGSIVPLFLLRSMTENPAVIAGYAGSIAGCSSIGFAIWVLVAWRPRRVGAKHGEHSLN